MEIKVGRGRPRRGLHGMRSKCTRDVPCEPQLFRDNAIAEETAAAAAAALLLELSEEAAHSSIPKKKSRKNRKNAVKDESMNMTVHVEASTDVVSEEIVNEGEKEVFLYVDEFSHMCSSTPFSIQSVSPTLPVCAFQDVREVEEVERQDIVEEVECNVDAWPRKTGNMSKTLTDLRVGAPRVFDSLPVRGTFVHFPSCERQCVRRAHSVGCLAESC